jgi:flagellar basal-body rod protein FlgB
MADFLSSNSVNLLAKSLDAVWLRQQVISENIANAETPGYKAKYVSFEDALRASLNTIGSTATNRSEAVLRALNSAPITVSVSDNESVRADGNSVNTDVENMELARAQIQHQYLVDMINDQFTRLRTVIGS